MFLKIQLKKKFLNIFFVFLLSSCSIQPYKITSGVNSLDKKSDLLSNDKSNKNDVVNILGETLLKEYPDERIWIYVETEKKKNFFGKKILTKNNILILEFDSRGILIAKKILDKNQMMPNEFEEITTKNLGLKEDFSKKFFTSLRKRFQNKNNSQTSK